MPNLPDELLVEIGRVAVHAAELDMVTASMWAAATGESPDQVDEVPWIVKIAGEHLPSLRTQISGAVSSRPDHLREPVLSWLGRAAALMSERNQIVHAIWLGEFDDGAIVQHGWHGRSGNGVSEDPAVWRDLALRLGGCGAAGWDLARSIAR